VNQQGEVLHLLPRTRRLSQTLKVDNDAYYNPRHRKMVA
jgi:hypothetical protein